MVRAEVREWHEDLGWGVLDSPETPGGCWTHYSVIETRRVGSSHSGEVYEYKSLTKRDVVDLEWEAPGQDGFGYRASSCASGSDSSEPIAVWTDYRGRGMSVRFVKPHHCRPNRARQCHNHFSA
jgi:CspA family cold shock protein